MCQHVERAPFEAIHIPPPAGACTQFLVSSAARQDDKECVSLWVPLRSLSSSIVRLPWVIMGFPAWSRDQKRNMSVFMSIFLPNSVNLSVV